MSWSTTPHPPSHLAARLTSTPVNPIVNLLLSPTRSPPPPLSFPRALKTKHETPKYGLIYHASLIGQSQPKNKGKISRVREARVQALGFEPYRFSALARP